MFKVALSVVTLVGAFAPTGVSSFALSPARMSARRGNMNMATTDKKRVLVIGGTRFSGLYLTRELFSRGHEVSVTDISARKQALTFPLPSSDEHAPSKYM